MKPIRTELIVLRRTNYGEADRILTVLTPEHGVRSVIAKGVRREKSKLAGGIELFSISEATLHQGKGHLDTLTSVRMNTFFAQILEDYDRLQFAYYVLKDIGKAAEQVHEPEFYEVLRQVLVCLNDTSVDIYFTEIWYRLQMAILLGVGANLATDVHGEKLKTETQYAFSVDEMSFVGTEHGKYTSDHIKLLRVLSSQPPKVAAHIRDAGRLLPDILVVARAAHE